MPRSSKFQQFFQNNGSPRVLPQNTGDNDGGLRCQIQDSDDYMTILMHDAIGDYWSGLDSGTIAQKIKDNKGKRLKFDINSFGGSAYDGIAIYNAAAMHDAEVTAVITGIGYSAASIIPMSADKIIIAENGSLGIHPAWLYTVGNRFALRDSAKWLETIDNQIIDTYAARTGQDRDKVVAWFEGENHDGTVFSGKECLEYGFADELIPLKKKKKESDEDSADNAVKKRLQQWRREHLSTLRKAFLDMERERIAKS